MGRQHNTTKADRLAAKREDQRKQKEENKENKISKREQLTQRKLDLETKMKIIEGDLCSIEKRVDESEDLTFLMTTIRGDDDLSKKWTDLSRTKTLYEHNITHLFARLHPQKFLERFHVSSIIVLLEGTPHIIMERNLRIIRKAYPEGTEFAVRLFEGVNLSPDFLGPVSNYIEAIRCYHIKDKKTLNCDCEKTHKGFILSKERQKLEDDLKFVVNEVIFESQMNLVKFAITNSKYLLGMDIPNPFPPLLTGMRIM